MGFSVLLLLAVAASASANYEYYPGGVSYGQPVYQEKMGFFDFLNPLKVLRLLIDSLKIYFRSILPHPVTAALDCLKNAFVGRNPQVGYTPYPGYQYPQNNHYQSNQNARYQMTGHPPGNALGEYPIGKPTYRVPGRESSLFKTPVQKNGLKELQFTKDQPL